MFGQFHGLPVHALVLHVAVVFAPLAGLVGLAFLVPKWQSILRWPLVAVTAIALGSLFVAKLSGQDLKDALGTQLSSPGNLSGQLVAEHQKWANRLVLAALVMFVLVVAAVMVQRLNRIPRWVGPLSSAVVAVLSVVVLFLTYQTGEAGAKAVWNPAGSVDYSAGK